MMHWIDWVLVTIPLLIVMYIGFKSQKYVRGVADFLTAGRVAGRYVLCVAGFEAGLGLISLVATFESHYLSGYAYEFWRSITVPVSIVIALTGYCIYRFRETRAMTMGQFLEIRYSRKFRLLAGVLQSISGIVNYGLFPAVGARFLVYFCGLPVEVEIFGMVFPTFALLMMFFLGLAVLIATMGGQITIMTTDCVQGLLSYPMFVIIVVFFLLNFSWFKDIAPAMLDRPSGQSFLNPFDIAKLRDFNLLYVIIGIMGTLINTMSWSGTQGYTTAAKNAHEQKLAGVLGAWRAGFSGMMFCLLTVVAYAYLNSDTFQGGPRGSVACRTELAVKAANDIVRGSHAAAARKDVVGYLQTGTVTPQLQALLDKTAAIKLQEEKARASIRYVARQNGAVKAAPSEVSAADKASEARLAAREARMQTAKDAIRAVDPSASVTFGTIFGQMRVAMALRYIMPIGITGLFCAICIFLMISTDASYIHSWGTILVQDVILPIRRGKPFTPKQQLTMLRIMIAGVAVFAFFFSYFFGQVDYILMYFMITGAIWSGGSGACIVFGLYWKRGTTAAAWVALTLGSTLSVLGILIQKYWVSLIYPWLYANGLVDTVAVWLQTASSPFEPILLWRMSSEKFPINSRELFGIIMLMSISLYVIVSLLTCRKPFNMDRMLHRGEYHREGKKIEAPRLTWRNLWAHLIGIDSQYTRGDKMLVWSVFLWSFGWGFVVSFVGVTLWNLISPWSNQGWSLWFFINNFVLAGIIGVVSTVWFTIGGTVDLYRLFRDLALKATNVLDDGRVIEHVSADDVKLVEQVEHVEIKEAHVEEEILREELKAAKDQENLKNLEDQGDKK